MKESELADNPTLGSRKMTMYDCLRKNYYWDRARREYYEK